MIYSETADASLNSFGLIGRSQAILNLIDTIYRVKDVDSNILVLGGIWNR